MKVILIAPSGGGKGSLAKFLVKDYDIPNISSGDLFRKNMNEGTPLGLEAKKYVDSGNLVPDELTVDMVMDNMESINTKNGFILDGFPRTLGQARVLDKRVSIDSVIELDVSDEIVTGRLGGRWTCKDCNAITNERFADFNKEKGCSSCGGELYQRKDDSPEGIKKRLDFYHTYTQDILDFYRKKGILHTIKITPEHMPEDTYAEVLAHFKERGLELPYSQKEKKGSDAAKPALKKKR